MRLSNRSRTAAFASVVASCLVVTGCAGVPDTVFRILRGPPTHGEDEDAPQITKAAPAPQCEERVVHKYHFSERVVVERAERKASVARISQLDTEIERLKSDLDQAEKALITAESSLTGVHTKAQAVRALAEARTQIENAETDAPWRKAEARDARRKAGESDRQLRAERFGAAILFASRAKRIAHAMSAEARAVRNGKAKQIGPRATRLRAKASAKSKLIQTLEPNTPIFPEKVHGKWVLVRSLSGKVGWVPTSALVAVPASPAPRP